MTSLNSLAISWCFTVTSFERYGVSNDSTRPPLNSFFRLITNGTSKLRITRHLREGSDAGVPMQRDSNMEKNSHMMTSSNRKLSALLALCEGNRPLWGNPPVTGDFPHKGQWSGALMFSLICSWTNVWANNRDAGDLGSHHAHYDATVMIW